MVALAHDAAQRFWRFLILSWIYSSLRTYFASEKSTRSTKIRRGDKYWNLFTSRAFPVQIITIRLRVASFVRMCVRQSMSLNSTQVRWEDVERISFCHRVRAIFLHNAERKETEDGLSGRSSESFPSIIYWVIILARNRIDPLVGSLMWLTRYMHDTPSLAKIHAAHWQLNERR